VEPLIALSVAYVGVENLVTSKLQPWRPAVVFAFGLLHGLGFAEALAELHLTATNLLATLCSFNVGIELGQLAVIGTATVVVAGLNQVRAGLERRVAQVCSAAIGVAGAIWTIQRLM
jgi:hypothetical protein